MTPETPYTPPLPAGSPAPHPDRSNWLTVFGVFDVLIGIVLWGMAALSIFAIAAGAKAAKPQPEVSFIGIVVMYGGLGTAWIILGIASAMRRNWARVSLLVLSSLWLAIGAVVTLFFAVIGPSIFRQVSAHTPNANVDPSEWKVVVLFMVGFSLLFMVLLPLVLVLFYSRVNVRASCLNLQTRTTPSRPILINLLAGWLFFGAAASLVCLPFAKHAVVFGLVLSVVPSALIFILHIALHLYSGWCFLKLRVAGWMIATFATCFWLTSGIVTLLTRNTMDLYREMEIPAEQIAMIGRMPGMITFISVFTLVIHLALLTTLIWSKRYFGTPPRTPIVAFSASGAE